MNSEIRARDLYNVIAIKEIRDKTGLSDGLIGKGRGFMIEYCREIKFQKGGKCNEYHYCG